MIKDFLIISILFFNLNSWAGLGYPSEQLAIIPKEELENAKKNPSQAREGSKKVIIKYLKAYNEEFKRLNKIDSDVATKKFQDIVMLNFDNTPDIDLIKNSQADIYKIKDWLDYEAYQIYNKFYLTSKKDYEFSLENPTRRSSQNQVQNFVQNPAYDSQISELNTKIKELSGRFQTVLDKAEELENQNRVLKNEIEQNQKKINSFETNLAPTTNKPVVVPAAVERNKNQNLIYIILGLGLVMSLIYIFGKRG